MEFPNIILFSCLPFTHLGPTFRPLFLRFYLFPVEVFVSSHIQKFNVRGRCSLTSWLGKTLAHCLITSARVIWKMVGITLIAAFSITQCRKKDPETRETDTISLYSRLSTAVLPLMLLFSRFETQAIRERLTVCIAKSLAYEYIIQH